MLKKSLLIGKPTDISLNDRQWNLRQYALDWLAWFQRWHRKVKTRKQLANLSDELLRDIGLTEQQVRRELRKTFWQ